MSTPEATNNTERHLHLYVGPSSDKKITQDNKKNTSNDRPVELTHEAPPEQQQTEAQKTETQVQKQPSSRMKNLSGLLKKQQARDTLKLVAILVLFHLSLSGQINQLLAHLFHNSIYTFNSLYLETASKESIKTLEVVAAIKSVLAILQSLSGGVSFIVDVEIQLGESLSVLNNITDKAWAISLSSVGAAEALSLLHHSVYFTMKPLLVTLFLLLGLSIGLKRMFPTLVLRIERLITLGIFLVAFTHIIVPISIYGTAKVSQHYLQPQKQILHSEFSKLSHNLPHHNDRSKLKDQVSELRKHFKKGLKQHTNKTGDYSLLAVKHIIYNVTEFILIPIFILILLSKLLIIMIKKEIPDFHLHGATEKKPSN